MVLNKKGIAFTMITITILSMFAVSYGTYNLIKDRSSINKRITTLNNFVFSVEKDLERELYVSGYRVIFLFNKHIADNGAYISNVKDLTNELFINGSLDTVEQDLMQEAKLSAIENFLNENANRTNANLSLIDSEIGITQEDPWNIKFTFNTTMILTDKSNLASWNRNLSIDSHIPITNFNDPIYFVETNEMLKRINRTPYSTFVSGGDYSNLTSHFQNSYYKESTLAPSYLNRLEGNFSADPNGVESIVYPQTLTDAGISIFFEKSLIDYIYFDNTNNPPSTDIFEVPDLRIDNTHCPAYNLTSLCT